MELSQAEHDVLAERRRHRQEGWTPEHDDHHTGGELALAAAAYAVGQNAWLEGPPIERRGLGTLHRKLWPWDWAWWKPKDRRRDLVRAGSLIIAEIERLDRAEGRRGAQTL
jgi:hypothetical protein